MEGRLKTILEGLPVNNGIRQMTGDFMGSIEQFQYFPSIETYLNTCANLTELLRLLIDGDFNIRKGRQSNRSTEASRATANNGNTK